MPLCLYECLKAVGLQHHYARFTSVGVHRAAHLSVLTMEDYPILGIRSMEDRTRLFHLVQMVKTLDLEYEDDENTYDEGCVVADSGLTYDGCEDPDVAAYYSGGSDEKGAAVSKLNEITKPSRVRRQLEFSCESVDHHLKPRSYPEGAVHVYASHHRNNVPVQGKESCTPVQLDTGSAEERVCKGKNSCTPYCHQCDHHTGENTEPNIMEGNYSHSLSPKCHSFHRPRPAAVAASNRFNKNPVGQKDRKGISRKEKVSPKISSYRASDHTAKPTPVYQSKRTAGYNYGLPLRSPPAPSKKQAGGQRISVCVRKRPLTHTECRRGQADVVTTPSGECVIVHEGKEAVDLSEYILQHKFYFDQVFGEESSNVEVYQRTAYPLVQHMLNGGKATCFAYGQTGAGKTHTMLGSPVRPGLYSLAVRDIFAHLSTTHMHPPLLVYVSFFEIYCGQLYDLLDHRKRLFAREDGQNVVHIVGLRDIRVESVSSLLEVISQGTEERTQGISAVNPLSSRSHALLQIQLRDTNQQIVGRMWFVDLAGSERASDTREPDKQSRMEGAEINQSLLALKECIRSLDQEQAHTPFRQSKLTQVLKDSFVGDSMTCMIANISPGHLATEHTLNTLRYADRVKELRGQGGRRGGQRGKVTPSSKHNLPNSSSIGTRKKSPPKKPKLGRQREDFGPTTMRSPTGGLFFCSTPKNSRWGDETRKGIGLEHITPVRDLRGTGEKRERADGRKGRRRERDGVTSSNGHSDGDHNIAAGLVLGQATDEQFHLWEELKKYGFYHRERQNQQENKGRRQVESSRNTCSRVERLKQRDLQKADERNKEREKHLRQYHQQLQQFMPPSVSSSACLVSPSTSFSSSVSPSSSSSLQSVSDLRNHGFEEVSDAYRGRVEIRDDGNRVESSFFPSGGICFPIYKNKKDVAAQSGAGEEFRVSREETEPRFVQNGGKHEKRGSVKATGRGLGEELEGEEARRWATTTEWADRMTGASPADVEALVSCNCDSVGRTVGEEGLDASHVPADGSLITKERKGADGCSFLSTHSDTGIFSHCPAKSSYQRAPAERPLSPVCGHTNTPLTLNKPSDLSLKSKLTRCPLDILSQPLQNAQLGVSPSSWRETQPGFAAHANRTDFSDSQPATLPPTIPTTQPGCKVPSQPHNILSESPAYTMVCNANMPVVISPEETADSHSSLMDPISLSLLHVDRQVATASFLQGEQNKSSVCPPESESRKNNKREVEKERLACVEMVGGLEVGGDIELSFSLLELPQAKSIYPHNSVPTTATNHIDTMPKQCLTGHSNHHSNSKISPQPNGPLKLNSKESNNWKEHITPSVHLSVLEDLDHGQCCVVQAHWKQLEEMEVLFHKEGTLLSHQPDMAFGEYVHKLEDILERKAQCVHNMIAQLQPYLKASHSNQLYNPEEKNHNPVT